MCLQFYSFPRCASEIILRIAQIVEVWGTDPIPERARLDEFKLKQGLWRENDKNIKLVKDGKPKVKNIAIPKKNRKKLLSIWFRYS